MRVPADAPSLDVLIPTYRRPGALAVTLTSLFAQTRSRFRVVVSDQTEEFDALGAGEVQAAVRALRRRGCPVELHRHGPPRGLAEHRQYLLEQARAPRVAFLDDDLILEPDLLERMERALVREGCGFVGSGLIGLSYAEDVRPHQQILEPWTGPVQPEHVAPATPAWERWRLHNAANLLHAAERLELGGDRELLYKVAWVGGCVLYDHEALRAVGGFEFWRELPAAHAGEDVLVQLRVMVRFGGCGLLPSGAYHQELPTTVADRSTDAPTTLRFATV